MKRERNVLFNSYSLVNQLRYRAPFIITRTVSHKVNFDFIISHIPFQNLDIVESIEIKSLCTFSLREFNVRQFSEVYCFLPRGPPAYLMEKSQLQLVIRHNYAYALYVKRTYVIVSARRYDDSDVTYHWT